jgi:hypothetical protein
MYASAGTHSKSYFPTRIEKVYRRCRETPLIMELAPTLKCYTVRHRTKTDT